MMTVYDEWAEGLQNFTLGAIHHAVKLSGDAIHPPSKGEFIAFCKSYNPTPTMLKIESKISPEKQAENRIKIAAIVESLRKGMQP